MTDYQEVRTTQHEQGREQRVATFKATQIIWLVLGFIEAMLALRIVFKLIAVNPSNPFAALLYSVTDLLVAPFVSLVGSPAAAGMVLEISSMIAMLVYLLIGWGLVQMVNVLFYRPRGPVSVSQTIVADHTRQPGPVSVSQTTTTDRITAPIPTTTRQTTVTESKTLS